MVDTTNDIKELAKADFGSEFWQRLYKENPDAADAVRYLLLMELHGGRGVEGKIKGVGEVSAKVAEEMGISPSTLAVKRREWMNRQDKPLDQARAMLAPLYAEQDAILADMVLSAKPEIMMKVMEKMMDKEATFYQLINGWDFLKREVLDPVKSKQATPDEGESEYISRTTNVDELISSEEQDYLDKS